MSNKLKVRQLYFWNLKRIPTIAGIWISSKSPSKGADNYRVLKLLKIENLRNFLIVRFTINIFKKKSWI